MSPAEFIALRMRIEKIFNSAAAQRKTRNTWVNGELAWVVFEREQMFKVVNEERSKLGLSPIGIEAVRRVESSAVGHSDYWRKFTLYCAGLVVDSPKSLP